MTEKVKVHIFVLGRVQGVFFRSETQRIAEDLGITGWVKNLADGKVEIVAEGEKEKLEKLAEWAKRGPFLAKVENLEINWQEYKEEFNSFDVR